MELPMFDTDAFSFLTDLQGAAWMPIVRQVLGPDVVIIHKGVFLAKPRRRYTIKTALISLRNLSVRATL
jgi:hypothetical protein